MDDKKSIGLGLIGTVSKKWDECTADEKIEKLKYEAQQMQYLSTTVSRLEETLRRYEQHGHIDGKVVVPMQTQGYGQTLSASRMNHLA